MSAAEQIRNYSGLLVKLALFIAVLLLASHAGNWAMGQLDFQLRPSTEPLFHQTIMLATIIYICLMALPFVPGIEIGLTMMAMFGAEIVPLIYLSTIVALILAFLVGRFVSPRTILDTLEVLRLKRARQLLLDVDALDSQQRLEFLLQHARGRFIPFLLKHRYIAVAVALNTPGNTIIGDGGGISFAAGFSRLFSLPKFALTVSLAVSPLPIAILLTS